MTVNLAMITDRRSCLDWRLVRRRTCALLGSRLGRHRSSFVRGAAHCACVKLTYRYKSSQVKSSQVCLWLPMFIYRLDLT